MINNEIVNMLVNKEQLQRLVKIHSEKASKDMQAGNVPNYFHRMGIITLASSILLQSMDKMESEAIVNG